MYSIDNLSFKFKDECAFCLENDLPDTSWGILDSCSHVFHEVCIKQFSQKNQNCPLCRREFIHLKEPKPDFQQAVEKNCAKRVRDFLEHWKLSEDALGHALYTACWKGHTPIVEMLYESEGVRQSDIDLGLSQASKRGHLDIIKYYLKNPKFSKDAISNAVHDAVAVLNKVQSIEILQTFLDWGAEKRDLIIAFDLAATIGNKKTLQMLFSRLEFSESDLHFALCNAAGGFGDVQESIVRILLEKLPREYDPYYAIEQAKKYNKRSIVKILLDYKMSNIKPSPPILPGTL